MSEENVVQLRKSNHLYEELIYAVETKFPNETRHETALRYIREAEQRGGTSQKTYQEPTTSEHQ